MSEKPFDIEERCENFTVDVIGFIQTCQKNNNRIFFPLYDQLFRSSGSIGANIIESAGAGTKKKFIRYHSIALRSGKESKYWLSIAGKTLGNESDRIMADEIISELVQIL